jgi:hypothetical protein
MLGVVARQGGCLTWEAFLALEGEDKVAIDDFVSESMPGLTSLRNEAFETRNNDLLLEVSFRICSNINRAFGMMVLAGLQTLPEEEGDELRPLAINGETWRKFKTRIASHTRPPHRDCLHHRGPVRAHNRRREPRRRSVSRGPRRARAPGRSGDDESEPERDLERRDAATPRLSL